MVTYTFPAGRFQGIIDNSAVDVIDATTNNPFFLSDWQTYRNTGQTSTGTTLAYPVRIDAAATNVTWNGGRFYGNIPQSVSWDNFYEGGRVLGVPSPTAPRFNSALLFMRYGGNITINDAEFGIRNDLNSGYVDGIRASSANSVTLNRPRSWCGRDDFIECDTNNGRTVTINDGFFENQFLWLSGTGTVPNTFFYVNRSLVHFRPWLFRSNTTPSYGAPLKVDSASGSPKFRFNDLCLVIGPNDYTDYNRMKNALRNTIATNGCRLLVLGGTHEDRELIGLYQTAGFSVLEDGTGDSATVEWNNRKAAFLNEGGPVTPPVTQSLTSPCTFDVFAGSASLTPPVLLGTEISGTNTDSSSFAATNPAYSVGDLVLVFVMNDGGTDRVGTVSVTAPNAETVTQEQAPVSDGNAGTTGHTISAFSYVATSAESSGANITCAISGGLSAVEQFTVVVMVFDAGTFNPTTRLVNKSHTFSTGGETFMNSAAFSAATADGRVVFVAARAFDAVDTTPAGWTQRANTDPGALPGYAATRDALTTSAESVAAATFSDSALDSRAYSALTVVVSPAV